MRSNDLRKVSLLAAIPIGLTLIRLAVRSQLPPSAPTDNLWHLYRTPPSQGFPGGGLMQTAGIAPDKDRRTGKPLLGTGTYPWQPGKVTLSSDSVRVTRNVPGKIVPLHSVGTVYYRIEKSPLRHDAPGSSQGTSSVSQDKALDASGSSISLAVWVRPDGSDWPEKTSLDLTRVQ